MREKLAENDKNEQKIELERKSACEHTKPANAIVAPLRLRDAINKSLIVCLNETKDIYI